MVSIPFHRESPFGRSIWWNLFGFRTGFHSLPPGKSFRTYGLVAILSKSLIVSIPFQRESPFGLASDTPSIKSISSRKFPFPSNGKVLSDSRLLAGMAHQEKRVSIPFHRESPFGLEWINRGLSRLGQSRTLTIGSVSIPFHRESPFGHTYPEPE